MPHAGGSPVSAAAVAAVGAAPTATVGDMSTAASQAWRPQLTGMSWDILPFYRRMARMLPAGAVCVEIGVAWGRSVVFLASEMVARGDRSARIYAVDPWDDPRFFSGAGSVAAWAAHASKEELSLIYPLRLWSDQAARLFEPRSLDLVFVDGLHSYEGCASDIRSYLPLMKSGGVLAGHDFGDFEKRTFGGPSYPGVDRAVSELLGLDKVTIDCSVWEYRVP